MIAYRNLVAAFGLLWLFNTALYAETHPLPIGSSVLKSWKSEAYDPSFVLDSDSDAIVVPKGSVVVIKGIYSNFNAKALELYVERKLVATKDYGGKYEFRWTASNTIGLNRLTVAELRRTGERYIIRKMSINVTDASPIRITSPMPDSKLTELTPITYHADSSFKNLDLYLYASGACIGKIGSDGITLNVPILPSGTYNLWLEGNSEQSKLKSGAISVSIPERVTIAKPVNNEKIVIEDGSTTIKLSANVDPSVKVQKLEFLCDGLKVEECQGQSTEAEWDATNVAPGQHKLSARVFDQAERVYSSAAVSTDFDNPPYRERQKEAALERGKEAQKRWTEEKAAQEVGRKQHWEKTSEPYDEGSSLEFSVIQIRAIEVGYYVVLGVYNGTSSELKIRKVELVMEDYSANPMSLYDQTEAGRKRIDWAGFALPPHRRIMLLTGGLAHLETQKPKYLEVSTENGLSRVALP
ncbi:MAG: Ig-like domain-containing protein [Armatimonadetes bacterium]|nr:Ig-like domain-containing protein [Armatimonadota bacterium]